MLFFHTHTYTKIYFCSYATGDVARHGFTTDSATIHALDPYENVTLPGDAGAPTQRGSNEDVPTPSPVDDGARTASTEAVIVPEAYEPVELGQTIAARPRPKPRSRTPLLSNPVRDAKWKSYVGGRVSVDGKGDGKLAYYGTTKSSKGEKKCGVALDEPNGKHDGMVNGQRYFRCTTEHGVLTSYVNVTMLEEVAGAKSLRKVPAKMTEKKPTIKKTGNKPRSRTSSVEATEGATITPPTSTTNANATANATAAVATTGTHHDEDEDDSTYQSMVHAADNAQHSHAETGSGSGAGAGAGTARVTVRPTPKPRNRSDFL